MKTIGQIMIGVALFICFAPWTVLPETAPAWVAIPFSLTALVILILGVGAVCSE